MEDLNSPVTKQVLIRATPEDAERWKQTAELRGLSMAEFIRTTLNASASTTLDCQHPMSSRKVYPWSDVCLACGVRLRG